MRVCAQLELSHLNTSQELPSHTHIFLTLKLQAFNLIGFEVLTSSWH